MSRRVVAFLSLTFALSAVFYVRIAAAGTLHMLPALGLMWCPATAAIVVRLATQRNLRGTGWGWGATRWQVVSYLLPPATGALVYSFVWLTGIGGFSPEGLGGRNVHQSPLPVILAIYATAGVRRRGDVAKLR